MEDNQATPELEPVEKGVDMVPAKRMYTLDVLRLLAAVHIVLYTFFVPRQSGVLQNICQWGNIEASFFFVLSGFCLTISYWSMRQQFDLGLYMIKRLARIYPTYVAMLIFVVYHSPKLYIDTRAKIAHFVLHLVLAQSWYSPTFTEYSLNVSTWAVSTLAFLYILFPVLLRLLDQNFQTRRSKLVVALLAWPFNWMIYEVLGLLDLFPFDSSFPILHIPAFWIGMCAGGLYCQELPDYDGVWAVVRRFGASVALAGMVFGFLFVTPGDIPEHLTTTGTFAPLQAFIIYWLANGDVVTFILGWAPSRVLGHLSYSVFLLAIPTHQFAERASNDSPIFYAGVLFFASCLFCTCVEVPGGEWIVKSYQKAIAQKDEI
eukprot:c21797_g1_i1.p1 GENE.c21797_g1_i1~~c21797_g1_i1.p1  ORF type:complete len:374 (+),score=49.77 c21797_g1_i1:44-1165(+)